MRIEVESINGFNLYYYDKDWQTPVITEYQIFKLFKDEKNIPFDYFAFPWATLIDNRNSSNSVLYNFVKSYRVKSGKCFTVIQHIYFYKYLDLMRKIGITHVFTPHKDTNSDKLEQKFNIKILSSSLYPAQSIEKFNISKSDIISRKYLATFIGQYNPRIYLTNIRQKIYDIFDKYDDCYIKKRCEWHYESMVYGKSTKSDLDNELEYASSLVDSKFSLCPSGSGPNSIRIWESMSYGSIPVILADTLILPNIPGIIWENYFVIWKESEIYQLYDYLKNISDDKLVLMSNNCIDLYYNYFCPNKMNRMILEQL